MAIADIGNCRRAGAVATQKIFMCLLSLICDLPEIKHMGNANGRHSKREGSQRDHADKQAAERYKVVYEEHMSLKQELEKYRFMQDRQIHFVAEQVSGTASRIHDELKRIWLLVKSELSKASAEDDRLQQERKRDAAKDRAYIEVLSKAWHKKGPSPKTEYEKTCYQISRNSTVVETAKLLLNDCTFLWALIHTMTSVGDEGVDWSTDDCMRITDELCINVVCAYESFCNRLTTIAKGGLRPIANHVAKQIHEIEDAVCGRMSNNNVHGRELKEIISSLGRRMQLMKPGQTFKKNYGFEASSPSMAHRLQYMLSKKADELFQTQCMEISVSDGGVVRMRKTGTENDDKQKRFWRLGFEELHEEKKSVEEDNIEKPDREQRNKHKQEVTPKDSQLGVQCCKQCGLPFLA